MPSPISRLNAWPFAGPAYRYYSGASIELAHIVGAELCEMGFSSSFLASCDPLRPSANAVDKRCLRHRQRDNEIGSAHAKFSDAVNIATRLNCHFPKIAIATDDPGSQIAKVSVEDTDRLLRGAMLVGAGFAVGTASEICGVSPLALNAVTRRVKQAISFSTIDRAASRGARRPGEHNKVEMSLIDTLVPWLCKNRPVLILEAPMMLRACDATDHKIVVNDEEVFLQFMQIFSSLVNTEIQPVVQLCQSLSIESDHRARRLVAVHAAAFISSRIRKKGFGEISFTRRSGKQYASHAEKLSRHVIGRVSAFVFLGIAAVVATAHFQKPQTEK